MAKKVEDTVVEEVVTEETTETTDAKKSASDMVAEGMNVASKTLTEAIKQVEGLGKELGKALQDRANVVMVRVNNESLAYLDMLVEADVTKSRSESAAFLINEGIKVNDALFGRIREITDQIAALKAQLRESVVTKE
jgi:hypothetical protein